MADFGATPEARALRIRAGVLLPFWQAAWTALEKPEWMSFNSEIQLRDALAMEIAALEIILSTHDRPEVMAQAVQASERKAWQFENPEAAARSVELIRQALPERDKRPNPGSADQFLRGAFAAWLKGRREGEELLLVVEDGAVDVRLASGDTRLCGGQLLAFEEIPAQARVAGAKAVRAAFKEIRS